MTSNTSTRSKKSWKPLGWLIGVTAAATLLSLVFWLGESHILPSLSPKTHVFEQEISFEKPASYRVAADLPWRGSYSLWLEFSTGTYPCDEEFLRGKLGGTAYDKEGKLLFRGVDWPLSWGVYGEKRMLSQGIYSRNLYAERNEPGVIRGGCNVSRKFAVVDATKKTFDVTVDLRVTQPALVPANAKSFVILRLDKPESKFVQMLFLAGPALGMLNAMFWREYGFLWLWGGVGLIVLLIVARRLSHTEKSAN